MQERRKHKRLDIKEKTSLTKGTDAENCFLIDISPGGMKVQLETGIKPGDEISGQFKILPKAGPFYVKGTVAWVKPVTNDPHANFEIGVKFTRINTIPF